MCSDLSLDNIKQYHPKEAASSMIAYLSGGMENAVNEGADWRIDISNWLKENLGHNVIDPVVESQKQVLKHNSHNYRNWKSTDPERFKEFIRVLIDHDLKSVIDKADYLIVFWDKSILKGGGTHGEVTMAYWVNKPVYLVNSIPRKDLSAWISSCSTDVYDSFDELKNALLSKYKPEE